MEQSSARNSAQKLIQTKVKESSAGVKLRKVTTQSFALWNKALRDLQILEGQGILIWNMLFHVSMYMCIIYVKYIVMYIGM